MKEMERKRFHLICLAQSLGTFPSRGRLINALFNRTFIYSGAVLRHVDLVYDMKRTFTLVNVLLLSYYVILFG